MIKLSMNLFILAKEQLEKKKVKFTLVDVIDRAEKLRKQLDEQEDERRRKINRKYYLKRKLRLKNQ